MKTDFKKITGQVSLLLVITFAMTACHKDNLTLTQTQADPPTVSLLYPGVAEALWPYFHEFEEEGSKRGLEIDLVASGITGVIEGLHDDGVAGQCTYYSNQANHVTIDQDFWDSAPSLWREFIVFHELGHCYLDRDHREDAFANGVCRSLMRSGLGDCYDNYNQDTRSYYLDELFELPLP